MTAAGIPGGAERVADARRLDALAEGTDHRDDHSVRAYQRLGLYCSAVCLGQMTPRLTAVEGDLLAAVADGW